MPWFRLSLIAPKSESHSDDDDDIDMLGIEDAMGIGLARLKRSRTVRVRVGTSKVDDQLSFLSPKMKGRTAARSPRRSANFRRWIAWT